MRQPRNIEIANLFITYVTQNVGNYKYISVRGVARELFLSSDYITKCCKQVQGKTASKIIKEIYIDKAISLYFKDSVPEKVIADMLGFSEESSFCHFFKNHTGKSITDLEALNLK